MTNKIYTLKLLKEMKYTKSKDFIVMLLIFGFTLSCLTCLNMKDINAQTYNKVILFPDVNLKDNKTLNNSFDQEFILVTNSSERNSQTQIKILNSDFGLNPPFVKLVERQEYGIDPLNEEDIKYANITIKLAQVLSVSPSIKIQDADPENPDDMTLGTQEIIANFAGGKGGVFLIPSALPSGKYILYIYIQYPYGITGVFSNMATIMKR